MKKYFRKLLAVLCAVTLIVSGVTINSRTAKAVDYSTLAYQNIDNNNNSEFADSLKGSKIAILSGNFTLSAKQYQNVGFSELYIAVADTNAANLSVTVNGTKVQSDATGIHISDAVTYLTYEYNVLEITSADGNGVAVIYCPANNGKGTYGAANDNTNVTTTASAEQNTTAGSENSTTAGTDNGQVTTAAPASTTASGAQAEGLPKKLLGLDTATQSGSDTIDNAVMFAWAGADNPDNVDGYDTSVTSAVIYIYKDGALVTKIANATNGGVVGGLSAGVYTAQAANVNSKGEGPLSDVKTFTVTGQTLNYTYTANCIGPKTPNGLSVITGNPEVPADNPAQADNKLGVAWAPSSEASIPSYDTSVVGYNLYIFDATTGEPYRRAYVDGASTSTVILESVSAGTYLVYLSAVNAAGEESALAASSFGQSSKVTVKGNKIDNAQSFNAPNQPTLPIGLTIVTEGIQYGFTVAWSADADLSGIKLNLYVDGVCIKSGINTGEAAYYENRLAAGTYTIEVKAQYTSNNVESFPLTVTGVKLAADPDLTTKTPAELADSSYNAYEAPEETTTQKTIQNQETTTQKPAQNEETTSKKQSEQITNTTPVTTKNNSTEVQETTAGNSENPTTYANATTTIKTDTSVGRAAVKKATKKKSAKKIKLSLKKVSGAKGYKVQISTSRKFKKILVTRNVKKLSATIRNKKLKNKKKLYVRVKAYKVVNGKTYEGSWSKIKKVKIKE